MPNCCLLLFAADNGVSLEGISYYPPYTSVEIVRRHLQGESLTRVLADRLGYKEYIVDVGLFHDFDHRDLVQFKVARGSQNLVYCPALTREQVYQALGVGRTVAADLIKKGHNAIGLGEIGVGNTIPACLLAGSILSLNPVQLVGPGSDADGHLRQRRIKTVEAALRRVPELPSDTISLLEEYGSLEIAAMAGAILEAGAHGINVILDGLVAGAAALAAARINRSAVRGLIASTSTCEPAHALILDYLKIKPLLDLRLNYGEGLGAGFGLFLWEMTVHLLNQAGIRPH